jgi:hypothetical protein
MPTGRHVDQQTRERIWAIVSETRNYNLREIGLLVNLDWKTVRDAVFGACGPALELSRLKRKMQESEKWLDWGP